MTTKLLESGTDATYGFEFWSGASGTVAPSSDSVVKNTGPRSIKFDSGVLKGIGGISTVIQNSILADVGRRITVYYNFTHLPTAASPVRICSVENNLNASSFALAITSGGVLQIVNNSRGQIGTNGSTLSTGTWYRISI